MSGGWLVGDQIQKNGIAKDNSNAVSSNDNKNPMSTLVKQNSDTPAKPNVVQVLKERPEKYQGRLKDGANEAESRIEMSDIHTETAEEKEKRRAAKAERKLQRQLRREARQAKSAKKVALPECPPVEGIKTPSITNRPSSTHDASVSGVKHAAKQRTLKHKRMSMMDSRALNEASHVLTYLLIQSLINTRF